MRACSFFYSYILRIFCIFCPDSTSFFYLCKKSMEMEDFSNQDTHIYDDEIIIRVLNDIFERYFFLLQDFYVSFKAKTDE